MIVLMLSLKMNSEDGDDGDEDDGDEMMLVFELVQVARLKVLKININWSNVTNEDY